MLGSLIRLTLLILAATLLVVPASGQPLDSDQQKCVVGLNKGGASVNKAQNKESARCWKLFQKGKESSAEGCWLADPRGKVTGTAQKKVFDKEPKLCGDIAPPAFGHTSAFIVVAAGREQSLFFLEDLFGATPDAAAALGQSASDLGRCQQEAIKSGHKVEETLLKSGNKTKKSLLGGKNDLAPPTTAEEFASSLTSQLLGDQKLQKAGEKLDKRVFKRCSELSSTDLQAGFPGCSPSSAPELVGCAVASARCRGCWKFNQMDDLALDCDLLDDFQSNASCPMVPVTTTPTPSSGFTPTNGPTPTTGPTPTNGPTPTTGPTPTDSPSPTTGPTPTSSPTPTLTPSDAPTPTFTPSFTPTLQATPTFTPSFTPTQAPVQEAPDDGNPLLQLTIPLDSSASILEFVSFPGGDTFDRAFHSVSGMNPNPSLPGGQARLVISSSCFGMNTNQIEFFTGGQTFGCGQVIVDKDITADSDTGTITITAVGGAGTYVQWVLTGTATRTN